MTVAVVTDSGADLPPPLARSAGVDVVPLIVSFKDVSFADGRDLSAESFWARVERGAEPFPTTASPPPEAFASAYRAAAEAGAGAVVSVHLSRALSRTVESAAAAAAAAPVPVEVVDSGSVSMGQGLVALEAANAASRGAPPAEVAAAARSAASRVRLFAMLDTVEFLRRGGRLGATKAALSDLLRVRPVLTMSDGVPELVARARTRGRGIELVLERTGGPAVAAALIHSGAPEAEDVARRLRGLTGADPAVVLMGAVIGAHLGPRAVGAAAIGPETGSGPA